MQSSFGKLGLFYFLQTITIFSITLPLVISLAPVVAVSGSASYGIRFGEPTDIVGLIFWAVGFTVELVADIQKFRFNKVQGGDGVAIMNEGLWVKHRRLQAANERDPGRLGFWYPPKATH